MVLYSSRSMKESITTAVKVNLRFFPECVRCGGFSSVVWVGNQSSVLHQSCLLPRLSSPPPALSTDTDSKTHFICLHVTFWFTTKNHFPNMLRPRCAWIPLPPLQTLSSILLITSPHGLPASCYPLIFLTLSHSLRLCFVCACLIKGVLSNEITPWGLMVWLIDRHTARED